MLIETEKDAKGVWKQKLGDKTYTYGIGLISERTGKDDSDTLYYHYNHLGVHHGVDG